MKNLVVDIDGVACDHAEAICNWVNLKYELNSKRTEVTTWDHNFGPISFVEAVKICYSDSNFLMNIKASEGFDCFYQKAIQRVNIVFATARADIAHEATKAWLGKNFNDSNVIFTKNKAKISGMDFLIDDYPGEIEEACLKYKHCFMYSQPWNQYYVNMQYGNCTRVNRFDEIIDFIC